VGKTSHQHRIRKVILDERIVPDTHLEDVPQRMEFELTIALGPLPTSMYRIEKSIHTDPAISAYAKVFTSVEVISISLHCMQYCLLDNDNVTGPKPGGYIRYGVIPENIMARTHQSFEAMKTIPHLNAMMLGSEQQMQSTVEVSPFTLSTMELDLAVTPRRNARPSLTIVNCGYVNTGKDDGISEKNKNKGKDWDLAAITANVRVRCTGQAFGG